MTLDETMNAALGIAETMFAESFKLMEELDVAITKAAPSLAFLPWYVIENLSAASPASCVRSRIAKFVAPVGASDSAMIKDTGLNGHVRLAGGVDLAFVSLSFRGTGISRPTVFLGTVGAFGHKFFSPTGSVLIERSDLNGFLETADFAALDAPQIVRGRSRPFTAQLRLHEFAPLSAMRSIEDVERLAARLVSLDDVLTGGHP